MLSLHKLLKLTTFIITLTVISCSVNSQTVIPSSLTKSSSFNYAKLANIDTMLNGYVNRNWVKSVVTIIVKDGQLVQYKGYGYSDAAAKKPMDANSIFRIASQTKAIVSAGILILYDEGKLSLTDPVSKYIPEFAHQTVLDKYNAADTTYTTVPAKRDITIKDLLTHTSGLDYAIIGSDNMKAIYAKAGIPSGLGVINYSLLERMKTLAKLPLAFQPGEQWRYSLGVDLLGCLIEVISGDNLEDFLRKNIFNPLGMKDTYFNVPQNKATRLATVYTENAAHQIIRWSKDSLGVNPDYPLITKHYFSGGAGLSSTAYDYAVFLQMIMNGGKYGDKRILSQRVVNMMLQPQLDFMFNGKDNFGLGFEIITAKGAADEPLPEGSFLWGGFFGTTYWADPKDHLICSIMTQQAPNSHYEISSQFEQMVYAALQ